MYISIPYKVRTLWFQECKIPTVLQPLNHSDSQEMNIFQFSNLLIGGGRMDLSSRSTHLMQSQLLNEGEESLPLLCWLPVEWPPNMQTAFITQCWLKFLFNLGSFTKEWFHGQSLTSLCWCMELCQASRMTLCLFLSNCTRCLLATPIASWGPFEY